MKLVWQLVACGLIAALASACSTTPGDAAARGGHADAAARLYRKGTEQGDGRAALKLGLLLLQSPMPGYGLPGQWFVLGCELGNEVACHNAGVGFEYSEHGMKQDYAQAREYYTSAARKGYMQSEYNLGSLYANAYFSDDVEGLSWLLAAQSQARKCLPNPICQWTLNDEPGHIARLRARMTQAQIADAEARANARAVRE